MNKKILKWVVILLVTFVLGWLLLKAVSVKETKVITSKNTYDILNNPHVSKVSDYISALMNHNHEKEKLFYEKLDNYSKDSTSSISYQSFKSKNGMLSLLPTYTRTKTGSDEIVDEMGLTGNIELGKCIVLVDDTLDNRRTVILKGKNVHILTEGGGSGILGGPNVLLRDRTWGAVDQVVIDEFKK